MSAYTLIPGLTALYKVAGFGASVIVTSQKPVEVKRATVGSLELAFGWQDGKDGAKEWRATPKMTAEKALAYTKSDSQDGSQLYKFSMEDLFAYVGIVRLDCSGSIRCPAFRFELADGRDVWALVLHSGWNPPKPVTDVNALSLKSGQGEARATVDAGNSGVIVSQISAPTEGFDVVSLYMRRALGPYYVDQRLADLKKGEKRTYFWSPILRAFAELFICTPDIQLVEFSDLLRQFRAQLDESSPEVISLKRDFVLCDGPAISYTLRLVGQKAGGGEIVDEASVSLAGSSG